MKMIDELANQCGQVEERHGFREDWELAVKLEEMANHTVYEANGMPTDYQDTLRQAATALRNNYVGTKLMLIVSEMAEAMESLRDTGVDGAMKGLGNMGEELADAHIRLWALEDLLQTNSGGEVVNKIEKNVTRPMKHGRRL